MSVVKVRRNGFRKSSGDPGATRKARQGRVSEIEMGGDELIGALSGWGLRYREQR